MKRKKIIILISISAIIIVGVYFFFFRNGKPEYSVEKVVFGNVVQEVSETGVVKKGEEINLGFKTAGRIEKIYVKVGDDVTNGQSLAKLDTSQTAIQLAEAKASLELAEAKETDAQLSLESAEKDLANIKEKAEEDLNNAYEDALSALDDAYLKIYNAFNAAYNIQKTYFTTPNEGGLKVGEEKDRIENALKTAENLKNSVNEESTNHDNIDSALSQNKELLEKAGNAVKGIRDITDSAVYRDLVSSTDKTSLDTNKLNINTSLTNVINAQQSISAAKITNTTNIDSAEAKVSALEAQLQQGGVYQAQISQAQAQVALLKKEIQESVVQSPTDGKITKVEKKEGEMVQATEVVISLLSSVPFQVEVDIYEEDIVNVKIGDPVNISLSAFPGKIFEGKVIVIDPAEKLIDGVVYYETTIDFIEPPQEIRPGMTADVIIKTASKENVLVVSKDAIEEKDDKILVQILKGKNIEKREIEIGLEGSDNLLEVISGLKEDEEVIIK